MKLCHKVLGYVSRKIGISEIRSQILEMKEMQKDIDARALQLEERSKEASRAIATLAIAHASLIRDLSDVISHHEKKKTEKKVMPRKTGDDFTN
jgi:hypothetical protein